MRETDDFFSVAKITGSTKQKITLDFAPVIEALREYLKHKVQSKNIDMEYEKLYLFGKKESRGTFDDFFDTDKFDNIKTAYEANDYIECDFVKDKEGILYIEARNVKNPEIKKYHRLNYQNPVFGLDVSDDQAGCNLANSLFC